MADLTKEYFDKQLKGLKAEIKADIKTEVQASEKRVASKIDDLNNRTANGFRDIQERLDVKARVEKLERNYEKISEALHL